MEIKLTVDDIEELAASGKPESLSDLVGTIGAEDTLKLVEEFGGNHMYVPLMDSLTVEKRNQMLMKQYQGGGVTIEALAKQYGLTPTSVYNIINRKGKRSRKSKKANL